VVANKTVTASIKLTASDVYNDDLVLYASHSYSTSVYITEKVPTPNYPDLKVNTEKMIVGESANATVTLQGGAAVAAGDFVITYDKSIFSVTKVEADSTLLSNGALIFINNNFSDGQIKFSYVNQKGSFADDITILSITLTPLTAPNKHFTISASGSNVCDLNYNDVSNYLILEISDDGGAYLKPEIWGGERGVYKGTDFASIPIVEDIREDIDKHTKYLVTHP
jgi:hypothetical protein